MSLESAYRQILTAAGMPSGFYDQLSDFTDWISKDVAPQEISQRVDYAKRYVANQDPGTKQALRDFYGVGDNELAAYFLDRNKAVPLLEKQAQAIDIGAAAFDQGLSISKDRAEHFADLGAGGNARQAYATVAAALPDATRLSSIYGGDDVTQADLEDEALGGLASAARKRQKLAGQEVASFSEGAGGAKSAFSKKRAGQV